MPVLRIGGYAAIFHYLDADRDRIERGAFLRTLARVERKDAEGVVPLLWCHNPEAKIGRIVAAHEDDTGLFVVGLIDKLPAAAALLKTDRIRGLSFGFRPIRKTGTKGIDRVLLDVDWFEVSITPNPAQARARITVIEEIVP